MNATRKQTGILGALAMALCSLALTGCNDHIDIEDPTTPPLEARISTDAMELKVGIAVGFTVKARHGNDEIGKDRVVDLVSDNPLVVGSAPTVRDREFVVYGVGQGTATIHVLFDGEEIQSIPVTVSPQ